MRKLLVSAAVLATTSSAFAGLALDGRYDYQSITSNSQASNTQYGESFFAFNYLRATYDSKIADNLVFDARMNFLAFLPTAAPQGVSDTGNNNGAKAAFGSPNTQANPVMPGSTAAGGSGLLMGGAPGTTGPNDSVDYAEVTQKFSDSWSLVVGKLKDDGLGGFESQVKSADLYLLSNGYLGNKDLVGAQLVYKLADAQELDLYYYNNDSATDTTRPGVNLAYHGTFGSFGVIANYSQIGEGQSTGGAFGTRDINKNYGTVGVSYVWNDLKFTGDYDFYTNATNALATTGNNRTLSDVVLRAAYAWGNWTPAVKFETFTRTGYQTAGTSDVTDNGINWSASVEYRKNPTDPFRYHLAYVNGTTNYGSNSAYGSNNTTVNGQFAFLGIRYMGDFLK